MKAELYLTFWIMLEKVAKMWQNRENKNKNCNKILKKVMKNVMNLTPEEKFRKDVRVVLRQIKEKQLYTTKKKLIEYSIGYYGSSNLPISPDSEEAIIKKLDEWGAIEIREIERDETFGDISFWEIFYLKILQPKFDELYRLYESGSSYSENKKAVPETKNLQTIIKPKTLELIAKEIGDLDSGSNLVEFLTNCGVKRELIEYPNTKWRMVYSVLLTLASLQNKEDRKILFKIIEGACHPLMYGGDKNLAKETADKFNSFLEYDNFFIENGLLWKMVEDPSGIPIYYDKDGNTIETPVYMILPQKIDKLYLYWNELIRLTKFYFANKDNQNDEINSIYFEIIKNIEETLNGGCGNLKNTYKKPFRNIIGCEFEIQRQGLTVDSLFVNLYDFLGEITECSLPEKNNVEKIKKDNSAFFAKIRQYSEQHLAKKEKNQELPATRIEITKIPELKIKKSEKQEKVAGISKQALDVEQLLDKLESDIKKGVAIPKTFEIQVKDREIWVNNYLLSKPHALGSNYEFFEYIRSQSPNIKIERKKLPSASGNLSLKEEVKKKGFIKILNELGFKGEILKAFFPKRSKSIVVYKGDKITKTDLEKAGIKIPLFIKELELAHLKNSPK